MSDPTTPPTTEGLDASADKHDGCPTSEEEDDDDDDTTSSSTSSSSDSSDSDDESSSEDVFEESLSSVTSSTANEEVANGLVLTLAMVQELRRSTSSGNLMGDHCGDEPMKVRRSSFSSDGYLNPAKDIAKVICNVLARTSSNELPLHRRLADRNLPSPKDTYETILREHNVEITYMASEALKKQAHFVEGTEVGYSKGLLNAVGNHDMTFVRNHVRIGGNVQCRNRFGETLVHAVVRKGTAEMLDYLIRVGEVSVKVCCDGGRTPLHDACWAASPDFDIVRCLTEECPDLLLVTDKRGFTPLSYVQKDSVRLWNDFLRANADLLSPKGVFQVSSPQSPQSFPKSPSSSGRRFI